MENSLKVSYKDMLLYAVTDKRWLDGKTLESQVEAALKNGATFLQLRDKDCSHEELVAQAKALKPIAEKYNVPFVVDDDAQAALEAGADGVHIGQSDMEYGKAREILGADKIIGMTAKTVEQAQTAEKLGADYIGTGAVFGSTTKDDAVYMPKERLICVADSVDIPVVAIGGINYDNMDYLKNTGVNGVAVVSAIFAQADAGEATAKLKKKADRLFDYRKKDIIFDLDGTLLDSMPYWARLSEEYALSKGAKLPDDFYEVTYTMDLNECGKYFQDVLHIDIDIEVMKKEVLEIMGNHYRYDIPAKPGMRRMILREHENGSRMCIFTNSDVKCAWDAMHRLGVDGCISMITTSYELGINKKDPASYRKVCELMGYEPQKTYIYEDVLHGIKTGIAAGCKVVGVYDKDSAAHWKEISELAEDTVNPLELV
jgi:thiamine-phosphate pyrophosphorylase